MAQHDFDAARRDFSAFVELAGHPPLADFQLDSVRLDTPLTTIVSPRGAGKSTVLALLALHWAFTHPGELVLVVSASEDAARRLLATARRFAVESGPLRGSVTDELAGLLTLSNGASIRSVAASEQAIRGWRASLLLIDEASVIPETIIVSAALPTVSASEHGRIVLASSAGAGSGAFYDAVVRAEAGDRHSRVFRWRLDECLAWVRPSMVEALRASMSPTRFAAEMEGVFASGADSLFSRAAIDRVTFDYFAPPLSGLRGPARMLGGLDWGERADRSALVAVGRLVGEERRFAVATAHRWAAGTPIHQVVEEVVSSPAHFHVLAAEANGLGGPCCQMLWQGFARRAPLDGGTRLRRVSGPVVVDEDWLYVMEVRRRRQRDRVVLPAPEGSRGSPQPFQTKLRRVFASQASKAATWSALRLLIDQERLLLPASATDLRRELLTLRVSLTASGGERIEAPGTAADDLADALGLAAYPYQDARGRWRVYLQDLCERSQRLPEPAVEVGALGDAVSDVAGGVPGAPTWASVFGPEVSVPGATERDRLSDAERAYWDRRREAERRVREANLP